MIIQRKLFAWCARCRAHLCADPLKSAAKGAAGGAAFGPYGAAIGAAAGLATSALEQLFGRSNMNAQAELSRQNMYISNELNRRNAMEQGVLKRMSTQGAGLNINSENGTFSPVAGSSPSSVSPQTNPHFFDTSVMTALSNAELAHSQSMLNIADVKLKERELKGKVNADSILTDGNIKPRAFIDDDGTLNIEVLSNRSTSVNSSEGFEAVKALTRWIKEEIPKINLSNSQSKLEQLVVDYQLADNNIISKMAKLPSKDYDLFVQNIETQKALESMYISQGELFVAEKELRDLEKSIQEDTNLGKIWEDISSGFKNGKPLEALGSILKALFLYAMSRTGINFSMSSSRSKSSSTSHSTVRHIK